MRKRNHEIKIRLDDQEFARLNAMVANTVFSRETFIRLMLAGYQLKAQPDVDTKALQLKFTQIGTQLNFLEHKPKIMDKEDIEALREVTRGVWEANSAIVKAFSPERMPKSQKQEYRKKGRIILHLMISFPWHYPPRMFPRFLAFPGPMLTH